MIDTGIKVQGDIFDKKGFFVDEGSSDVITNLLISFYSSPITPVREIYTNALEVNDSSQGKIIVDIKTYNIDSGDQNSTLLNSRSTSGVITISDNGSGMSRDFVENSFRGLGISTKLDENGIGGFGLGAKSASYISNNAIWRTTQDGITTTLIVSRNDVSTESKLDSEYTGEPNGTKVIMPVSGEIIDYITENINTSLFDYQNPDDVIVLINDNPINVGTFFDSEKENQHYAYSAKKFKHVKDCNITVLSKGKIPYSLDNNEVKKIVTNLRNVTYKGFNIDTKALFVVNIPDLSRKFISPNRESLNISNRLNDEIYNTIVGTFKNDVDSFINILKSSDSAEQWGASIDREINNENSLMSLYYDSRSRHEDFWINHYSTVIEYLTTNYTSNKSVSLLIKSKKDGNNFLQYDGKQHNDLIKNIHSTSKIFSKSQILILGSRSIGKSFDAFFEKHKVEEFFDWNGIVVTANNYKNIDPEKLILPDYVNLNSIKNNFDLITKFIGLTMINYSKTREQAKQEGMKLFKEQVKSENKKDVIKKTPVQKPSNYLYYNNGKIHHAMNALKLVETILSCGSVINKDTVFMIVNNEYGINDNVDTDILNSLTQSEKDYLDSTNTIFIVNNDWGSNSNRKNNINRALKKKNIDKEIYPSSFYNNIKYLKNNINFYKAKKVVNTINRKMNKKDDTSHYNSNHIRVYNLSFSENVSNIARMKIGKKTIFDHFFPQEFKHTKKEYKELEAIFFAKEDSNKQVNSKGLISEESEKTSKKTLIEYFEILENINILSRNECEIIKNMIKMISAENDLIEYSVFDKIIKIAVNNITTLRSI